MVLKSVSRGAHRQMERLRFDNRLHDLTTSNVAAKAILRWRSFPKTSPGLLGSSCNPSALRSTWLPPAGQLDHSIGWHDEGTGYPLRWLFEDLRLDLRLAVYRSEPDTSTVEVRFSGHRFSGKPRFKGHSSENLVDHFLFLLTYMRVFG